MARVRWLTIPATVVVLAACGSAMDTSTEPATSTPGSSVSTTAGNASGPPAVIHLGRAAASSPESASDTPLPVEGDGGNGSDGQIEPMPIQPSIVTYVTKGDLPALTGSGPSWQLSDGTSPDPAQVERVARALGK